MISLERTLAAGAVVAVAWLIGGPASAQEPAPPPNVAEANERVARGEALFQQGDFDAALAEFEEAYEVIGEHPARFIILYNIGQSHERRFRYDLAIRYYERYLSEGGPNAPDRTQVEASLNALRNLLGTIHVTVNIPNAQVWVEERMMGTAPGDVLVPAGRHVIEVRAEGYAPSQQEIQIAAQTEQSLEFTLSETFSGLSPAVFWIFAGTTVAVGLAGMVVGILAITRSDELRTQLDDPVEMWLPYDEATSEIDNLALTADILYGSALLFGATAIVLALLTDWDGSSDEAPAGEARVRFAPWAGPTGGGAAMGVTW